MYCAEMAAKEKAVHETRWLNAAWVLLLAATAITYVLGEMGLVSQAGGWFLAGLGVLTVVKGVVVIQVFLGDAPCPRAVALAVAGVAGVGDRAGSAGLLVGAGVRCSDSPAAA